MRSFVASLALLSLASPVYAEGLLDRLDRLQALESARDLERAGIALSVLGSVSWAAAIGVGAAEQAGAFRCSPGSEGPPCDLPASVAVASTAVSGAELLVAGVVMWAVGAGRARRLERSISPAPGGLAFRF
jgi:hypothetical protein